VLVGAGLGALGVMALAVVGYLLLGRGGPPQPTPTTTSVTVPTPAPTATALAPTASVGKPAAPRPLPTAASSSLAPSLVVPGPDAAAPGTTKIPVAEPAGPTPAEARLDRANEHMEKGRYGPALAEAKAILARDPDNADAKALAGDAEAAIVIEECVKRGRAALKANDREAALAEARKGLSVNPSEARLLSLFREATQ
jgi:hypothetical protein